MHEKGSGREAFEAVNHGRKKGRKEQCRCVQQSSDREVSGVQQKRSGSCWQRGNIRCEFEDKNEAVGSKRDGEKKRVRRDILQPQEIVFSEELQVSCRIRPMSTEIEPLFQKIA